MKTKDTIYVDGFFCREKEINNKQMISISLDWNSFIKSVKPHVEDGRVRLELWPRKEIPSSGLTHFVKVDTYKSTKQNKPVQTSPEIKYINEEENNLIDIPF